MTDYNAPDDNGDGESYKDAETLRRLYWGEELSTYEIGERFGVADETIRRWMDKHGLERNQSYAQDYGLDERTLRRLYYEEKWTLIEIGERVGCTTTTVRDRMDDCGLERRSMSESHIHSFGLDEKTLRRLYRDEHLSCREIGERYSCDGGTVRNRLGEFGIETRSIGEWTTYNASKTPASFSTAKGGYERSTSHFDGRQDEVLIHRLLAVAEYGFDAVCGMVVHHKNEVPWDNRPTNIELMTRGDHTRHHNPLDGERKVRS